MKRNILLISAIITFSINFIGCKSSSDKEKITESASSACTDHDHKEGEDHTGHDHSIGDHTGHDHEEESHSDDEIIISPDKAKSLGIKTAVINPGNFNTVIKTTGQIETAQGDEKTIVAPVAGIISYNSSVFNEGQQISTGEILVRISNTNVVDGDPFIKAKAAYETAKSEYLRDSELVKDKIVSEKEFLQTKERYLTAKAMYDALAVNRDGDKIAVKSPISGFIRTSFIKDGEYVAVGQPIATVSQSKKLRLKAEVPEKYYSQLSSIKDANFTPSYGNQTYNIAELNGKLISYGKSSSENSFYIPVIFEFDNNGTLVPGTFTEVYLKSTPISGIMSVPVSSLIEDQSLYYVFVKLDDEGYEKREVKLGHNNGNEVEIISGIKPGDEVVTDGAIQVKLAASSSVIPEGHNHAH